MVRTDDMRIAMYPDDAGVPTAEVVLDNGPKTHGEAGAWIRTVYKLEPVGTNERSWIHQNGPFTETHANKHPYFYKLLWTMFQAYEEAQDLVKKESR